MPKHTSLPWAVREVYEDGIVVSRGIEDVHGVGLNKGSEFELFDKDTAEFIVKACNSHDDLLEACERYVSKFGNCGEVYDQAKKAIAKAF